MTIHIKSKLKKALLASCCAVALGVSGCAKVDAPSARNASIPAPATAKERPETINEGYDPVIYVPLGEDVLIPKPLDQEPLPDRLVGPIELRNETLASALQLILADYDIPLAFETEEALSRRITVSGVKGNLESVVNRICSLADLYCSYEEGVITVKETQAFVVSLPPIGEDSVFSDVASGIEALTGNSPVIDASTNTMIYTASHRSAKQAESYFNRLRGNTALVVFETYIWEVQLDGGNSTGIQWDYLNNIDDFNFGINIDGGVDSQLGTPISIGLPTRAAVDLTSGDVVRFLSSQGTVKTISQPQITVLSGSEAELRVVETINYVESLSRTTDEDGDETVSTSTSTVDSGFTLNIASGWDDSTVYGNIEIELDEFLGFETFNAGASETLQLPRTSERDLTTQVRVRPGDSILIAGLVREQDEFNTEGPGLNRPIFPTSRTARTTNSELVFLLRPRVIAYVPKEEQERARNLDEANKKNTRTQSLLRKALQEKQEAEEKLNSIRYSLSDALLKKDELQSRHSSLAEKENTLAAQRQRELKGQVLLEKELDKNRMSHLQLQTEVKKAKMEQEAQASLVERLQNKLADALIEKGRLSKQMTEAKARIATLEAEREKYSNGKNLRDDEIRRLNEELEEAQAAYKDLLDDHSETEISTGALRGALDTARLEKVEIENELERAQEKLRLAQSKNAELEHELTQAEIRLDRMNSALMSLRDEKTQYKAELDTLKETLNMVQARKAELSDALNLSESKLSEAKANLEVVELERQKLQNQLTQVENQIASEQLQENETKKALIAAQTRTEELERKLSIAVNDRQSKETEITSLREALEDSRQKRIDLTQELKQTQGMLATFEQDYAQAKSRIGQMEETIKNLTHEHERLKVQKGSLNEDRLAQEEELARLRLKLEDYNAIVAAYEKAEAEKVRLNKQIEDLSQQLDKTRLSLSEAQNQFGQSDSALAQARQNLEMATAEKSELQDRLDVKTTEIESLKVTQQNLKAEMSQKDMLLTSTQDKLERALKDNQNLHDELADAQAQLEQRNTEIVRLKSIVDEQDTTLVSLKQELTEAKFKAETNAEKSEVIAARAAETKSLLESMESEKQALMEELKTVRSEAQIAREEKMRVQESLQESQKERNDAIARLEKTETDLDGLANEKEGLMEELNSLRKSLVETENALEVMRISRKEAEERLQKAETQLREVTQTRSQLEAALIDTQTQAQAAQRAYEDAQKERTVSTEELRRLRANLSKAQADKTAAQAKLNDMQEKTDAAQNSYLKAMQKSREIEKDLKATEKQREQIAERTMKFGSFSADLLNPGAAQ